ncbi:PepSY domain-containing protein [Marinobacter sp.]|uniref:PepSY domain-containing protein n=1 Tax=Marinobacter sp. TaxID=50741 RepID=UPI003B52E35B
MNQLTCCLLELRFLVPRMVIGVTVFLVASVVLCPPTMADDDDDWRQLHDEVQAGRIKPLSEILDNLARNYIGQVIDVDIDDDDGERVYEIELLGPQGQVVEFEVDAVTGELIGIEGRNINGMTR